jgi:hypothetical protein
MCCESRGCCESHPIIAQAALDLDPSALASHTSCPPRVTLEWLLAYQRVPVSPPTSLFAHAALVRPRVVRAASLTCGSDEDVL